MNWKNPVSYSCVMSVKKVVIRVKGLISPDTFVSRGSLVGDFFFFFLQESNRPKHFAKTVVEIRRILACSCTS